MKALLSIPAALLLILPVSASAIPVVTSPIGCRMTVNGGPVCYACWSPGVGPHCLNGGQGACRECWNIVVVEHEKNELYRISFPNVDGEPTIVYATWIKYEDGYDDVYKMKYTRMYYGEYNPGAEASILKQVDLTGANAAVSVTPAQASGCGSVQSLPPQAL